jgi:XXXCH domain-containing protein
MGAGKKNKIEHEFSPAEAADYLRQLAQALEEGHISLDQRDMLLEGEVKVSRSLKDKAGQGPVHMRLKLDFHMHPALGRTLPVEPPGQEGPIAGQEAKVSFKQVKKDLSRHFKAVKKARQAGEMPPLEEVEGLAWAGRLMCGFGGKGDEFFSRFLEKLKALEEAAQAGRGPDLDRALGALGDYKRQCHSKRK